MEQLLQAPIVMMMNFAEAEDSNARYFARLRARSEAIKTDNDAAIELVRIIGQGKCKPGERVNA